MPMVRYTILYQLKSWLFF